MPHSKNIRSSVLLVQWEIRFLALAYDISIHVQETGIPVLDSVFL